MRRLFLILTMLGLLAVPVFAQSVTTRTLTSATCTTGALSTGCVVVGTNGVGGIGIGVSGTFSGTLTFKSSVAVDLDCTSANYTTLNMTPSAATTPVTTTTGTGSWTGGVGGKSYVCVVFTSYTSGSAVISLLVAPTTGRAGSGSGGGGGSGDALTTDPLSQFASTTSAQLAGVLSNETGTGVAVFNNTPTLIAPLLGTPTSGVLTNATGYPVASLANLGTGVATALTTPSSANVASAVTDETGTGALVFANTPTLVTPILGTPTSGTLTNATGYLVSNISGSGSNVNTFLATPTSANLAAAVTNETGSGLLVFGTSPTLTTPDIGVATATTVNKVTITAPASGSTLTIANGKTLTASNTMTQTATDGSTVAFGTGGTVAYNGSDLTANQVVSTHLTAALPANQGGTGLQGTLTGLAKLNGTSALSVAVNADLPTTIVATSITGSGAVSGYGGIYEVNCSGCTITIDTVASNAGKNLVFYNIGGSYTIDPAGSETICDTAGCTSTKTYTTGVGVILLADVAGAKWIDATAKATSAATVYPKAPGLRLTTETGVCASSTDRTAQGTIYFTPCASSYAAVYSGSAWIEFTQAELSLALTATSGKNYDVFYAYNSGTPNLALSAAWTNDTTRADALATQNGMTVKSADHTLLWIGTIRASGTNVTEDSAGGATTQVGGKRFVWNAFNRQRRGCSVFDSTDSWTYATNTWRQINGTAGNKCEYVSGLAGMNIDASSVVTMSVSNTATRGSMVGIGVDSTSAVSGIRGVMAIGGVTNIIPATARYTGTPGLGYHFVAPIEKGGDGSVSDFYGDNAADGSQSGLVVTLED